MVEFTVHRIAETSSNEPPDSHINSLVIMKRFQYLLLLLSLSLALSLNLASCKKDPAPAPDPYAFLQGTWRYANGAECLYDAATKMAKLTKVPTNNTQFKFVVGEDCWRNVLTTGTDAWSYEQIVRFSDGKTVEYRKSTMKKKDANTLTVTIPGLADSELTRVP